MRTAVIYNFLIEANIIAGVAILLMIPVRKYFRKQLGNKAICFAWLLVAVRLLCPLSLPNPLINEIVTPYNDQPTAIRPIAAQVKVRVSDALTDLSHQTLMNHLDREGLNVDEASAKADFQTLLNMRDELNYGRGARKIMAIYALGAAAVAAWFVAANVKFQRDLKKNRVAPLEGELQEYYLSLCEKYGVKPLPAYFVDPLSSACLVGVFHPYIALPLAANVDQAKQMLAHELCHYKAKDHLWTLLTLICCVVHWFNPLVWAAAAMSRMDRELRCDDNVTKDMDEEARKLYAGTLIQSVTRRAIPGLPVLATGMSMTGRKLKTRVGSILWGGKRKKAFAITFTVLASVLLICAFGTAAYGEQPEPWTYEDPDNAYFAYESQTIEEAMASENAIKTEEEALQRAKEILSMPEFQVDVNDPKITWQTGLDIGVMGKWNYAVIGQKGEDENLQRLIVWMAMDGSGAWQVYNGFDPFFTDYDMENQPDYQNIDDVLTEEEQAAIKRYCIALTEKLEPGESENFQEIHFNCYMKMDDKIYVQLEAPYNINSGKGFILLVKPEIRVIDYSTGNG